MNPDRLSDLFTDGAHRVEGVHRPLEHHRDVPPAVRPHAAITTGKDVDPVEQDLTGDLSVGWQQSHHRQHQGGLATSRLPDDPEPVTRVQGNRDATDCVQVPELNVELNVQVANLQDGAHGRSRAPCSGRTRNRRTAR